MPIVQTTSEAYTTPYSMGTGVLYPGVMWQGRDVDHSRPSSADVKN